MNNSRKLQAVIELGFLRPGANVEAVRELLQMAGESIGVAIRSALYRERLSALLEKTRRQTEELQVQQDAPDDHREAPCCWPRAFAPSSSWSKRMCGRRIQP